LRIQNAKAVVMGGMSSLSYDNIFSPDASEQSEGVPRVASASRSPKLSSSVSDAPHPVDFPKQVVVVPASPWALSALRRTLEIAVAAFAIIGLLPVMLVAGLLVRWSSPGPVFFRQRRMGRNGKEFTLYKFRSMCPRKGSNSCITVTGDVRITPIGALLRRYKLDELPQFWNVLRGDMSLVGPRPKLPHHEALVMVCRPGITGVATLAFRNEEEFLSEIPEDQLEIFYETFVKPAKAQLDLEYMRTATLGSDLRVLWRTASACLSSSDALAESAETIMQHETVARMWSGKFPSVSHPMAQSRVYPAGLNQEL
jgi:lipopolysaccharide/colanic/teichoic acid biosynthesis glycosyltransferase